MKYDEKCSCCGKLTKGKPLSLTEYFDSPEDDLIACGHVCPSCLTVSCFDCKKKAINHHWWFGYDKFKCYSCGNTDSNLVILTTQKIETNDIEKEPQQEGTSEQIENGIFGPIIGVSAAIIFLFVSGAPILEGGPAMIKWLGDGGFIYLVGAIVLGFASPKFMGK